MNKKNEFLKLFMKIYRLNYSRILFETGLTFLNSLLKFNLINDLYVLKSNLSLKNYGSNNASTHYIRKIKLNKKIKINLNNDSLYKKEF